MRRVHALAHREHFLRQRGGVARPTQDRVADRLERSADLRVAGAEARARQRLVLPRPRPTFSWYCAKRLDRGHQQPGSPDRAAARRSVSNSTPRRGARGEPVVEALREPRVVLRRALVGVVVEEDQVEVGGVAELLAAELAVGDHREARLLAVARAQLRPAQLQRHAEHAVGERGQVVGELLHREQAGEVLRQQAEHLRLVLLAQHVHLPLGVAARRRRARRAAPRSNAAQSGAA